LEKVYFSRSSQEDSASHAELILGGPKTIKQCI